MPLAIPTGTIGKTWSQQNITTAVPILPMVEYINTSSNDIVITDTLGVALGERFRLINSGPSNFSRIDKVGINLFDTTLTAKPTAANPTIDGITIKENYTVVFTGLTGAEITDNHRVFTITNITTTPVYTPYPMYPINSVIKINNGTRYYGKEFKSDGTNWVELTTGSIIFNGVCYSNGYVFNIYKLTNIGDSVELIKISSYEFRVVSVIGLLERKPYGGIRGYSVGLRQTNMESFLFATTVSSVVAGTDLTPNRMYQTPLSSTHFGYLAGGRSGTSTYEQAIYKFSFITSSNAIDVGNILAAPIKGGFGSSYNDTGYISGGMTTGGSYLTNIQRISFSTDGNSISNGNLIIGSAHGASASSQSHAYNIGGNVSSNIIKYPFSSNIVVTTVGILTAVGSSMKGCNSDDYAYSAGFYSSTNIKSIEKISFSIDSNSIVTGDMSTYRYSCSSHSTANYGFYSGGNPALYTYTKIIDRLIYALDNNSVQVGNLNLLDGEIEGLHF